MSEWQSDISEAEKALGILDQQLADGTITQDEYNTKQGELSGYLTRLQGGLEDQNDAYLASVQAKADFMAKQDELNAALANGEITQEEYNSAIGAAEEAMIGAQTPIESLIKAITDLVTALTGVPPETDATVNVDTVVAEEAIGTVQEGFTEFDGGESQGTLTVDNSDAVADTEKASEDAVAFAEAEYMAQVEADPAVALRETAAAQQEADDFVNGGPYVSLLEANDQASLPIGDVRGSLNSLISQNYTVHVTADISAVYAAVAEANALLPSSPAEKGPLARTPKWDWAFASAVPAAERYVTQAADVAAGFMPFDGVARTGALSEAVDWGWLFEDIPADAEDYAAQSADAFISFFSGNLEDIANGQAMYDAQQALEESLMIRQIAVDAGLGADVIAEIDARIQAQRARHRSHRRGGWLRHR
jgi:hypothetical protein